MKILIVGGGMGGTILANNLARRLKGELKSGKAQITMLAASDQHMYQPQRSGTGLTFQHSI